MFNFDNKFFNIISRLIISTSLFFEVEMTMQDFRPIFHLTSNIYLAV